MNAFSPLSRVEYMLEPERGGVSVKAAGDVLFAAGAIAILPGEPRPMLIGDLQWLDDRKVLIFTAYGDAPSDAHLLHFDDAIVNERGSITFLHGGHLTGVIQRIEDADLDDPDDYRIAWQFWQDAAPVYRPLIQRCYDVLQANARRLT